MLGEILCWIIEKADQCFETHPFDASLYQAENPRSYDSRWLCLLRSEAANETSFEETNTAHYALDVDTAESVSLETLISFFNNPAQYFAQQRLGLHLLTPEDSLSDAEPFEVDALTRYQIREQLSDALIQTQETDSLLQWHERRGFMPDNPDTIELLTEWQNEGSDFATQLRDMAPEPAKPLPSPDCSLCNCRCMTTALHRRLIELS